MEEEMIDLQNLEAWREWVEIDFSALFQYKVGGIRWG